MLDETTVTTIREQSKYAPSLSSWLSAITKSNHQIWDSRDLVKAQARFFVFSTNLNFPNASKNETASVDIEKREDMTMPLEETDILEAMVENDITVYMPPKNRYTIHVDIVRIRRADPPIVEPDWL